MQIKFENRTAIITGSTAGIGFAIAKGLAAAGANVVLNGRTQARVDGGVVRSVIENLFAFEPAVNERLG